MRFYRGSFGIDNGYDGTGYVFGTNKEKVLREAKRLSHENYAGHPAAVTSHTVRNRDQLLDYLNTYHSQASE